MHTAVAKGSEPGVQAVFSPSNNGIEKLSIQWLVDCTRKQGQILTASLHQILLKQRVYIYKSPIYTIWPPNTTLVVLLLVVAYMLLMTSLEKYPMPCRDTENPNACLLCIEMW